MSIVPPAARGLAALGFAALALVACGTSPPGPAAASLENGSFTATLAGRTMHYEVHGAGPVLMTVPNAWGLSLEGLRALFRPLEAGVTVVYFDPRGMGSSGPVRVPADMSMAAVREDFHALRRHLGLERVHAIGWSGGAMNLVFLAHEQPSSLESAVFVHGVASFGEEDVARLAADHPVLFERWTQHEQEIRAPELTDDERTARLKAFWLGVYFPAMVADRSSADVLARAFGPAQFSYPHARHSDQESAGFDTRAILPEIPVRSLVIAGANDLAPTDKVKELADGLSDARFVVFERSGHFAPLEEPGRFREVVLAFLGVRATPQGPR